MPEGDHEYPMFAPQNIWMVVYDKLAIVQNQGLGGTRGCFVLLHVPIIHVVVSIITDYGAQSTCLTEATPCSTSILHAPPCCSPRRFPQLLQLLQSPSKLHTKIISAHKTPGLSTLQYSFTRANPDQLHLPISFGSVLEVEVQRSLPEASNKSQSQLSKIWETVGRHAHTSMEHGY